MSAPDNSLFDQLAPTPLAESLRPSRLDQVLGQDHLLNPAGPLGVMMKAGRLSSLILWGGPGCGKTTLARLLADHFTLTFASLSAVFSGVSDLRRCFAEAQERRQSGQGTLLFVDEIHRFNKSQQDAFLPVVENGVITLIGATTENPSFELNGALLSRCQVLVLNRLEEDSLAKLIDRSEGYYRQKLPLTDQGRSTLVDLADGDGRYLLNMVEMIADYSLLGKGDAAKDKPPPLSGEDIVKLVQRRRPLYDKSDDSHYNLISALHKSLRGSDPDASLYWLARMIEGGEDPNYIARRLTRFAYEDIGMADPQAAVQALAAWECYRNLGSPEGDLALSHLVIYLASAPKSNAAYRAHKLARKMASETGALPPPKHILNAPTRLMKDLGYAKNYRYDHNEEDAFSGANYFPDGIERAKLYQPTGRGFEKEIAERIETWDRLRTQKKTDQDPEAEN